MSKKYSSIKLIEKTFNSKEKGSFQRSTGHDELIFLELYLVKKFKHLLHYLPFTELVMLDDRIHNKILFGTISYNNGLVNLFGKNDLNIDVYKEYFKIYKDTKKRFTLFIVWQQIGTNYNQQNHSLVFLYDKKFNELELFDSAEQNLSKFKPLIKDFFTSIYGNKLKIIYPYFHKPFGILNGEKCDNFLFTSTGFCAAWVLWYIEYRLTNINKTRKVVLRNAIKQFNKGDKICRVIRGYAMFIDKFLEYYKLDVNEYRGYAKIIDLRTNKKYTIPLKIISLFGLTAGILYIIKKLNLNFKNI